MLSAPDLTTLCLACGLCCDGTLFTQVPLRPEELPLLHRHHLPIVTRSDGTPALPQRCAALTSSTHCDIYDERPAACRTYRCMLHIALASDEVSLPEALATVAQTRTQLAALAALLPGPEATMQRARQALRDPELPALTRSAIDRAAAQLARHFDRGARFGFRAP